MGLAIADCRFAIGGYGVWIKRLTEENAESAEEKGGGQSAHHRTGAKDAEREGGDCGGARASRP